MLILTSIAVFGLIIFVADLFTKGRILRAIGARAANASEALADRVSDPAAEATLAISTVKNRIAEAKSKLITIKAKANALEKNVETIEHQITNFDRAAKLAGSAGNEADVRSAVLKIGQLKANLAPIKEQFSLLTKAEQDLTALIQSKENELKNAEAQKDAKLAQLQLAKTSNDLADLLNTAGGALGSSGVSLAALDEAIAKETASAEVRETFSSDASLLEKYSGAESSAEIDSAVAAYLKPADGESKA